VVPPFWAPTVATVVFAPLAPEALEARREGLLAELLRRSAGHELLPDGLRIRFAPSSETLGKIARAVDAERHCCRFLRFTVIVEPGEGPVTLTGPPGTREFLAAPLENVTSRVTVSREGLSQRWALFRC
jgi:hypothetical protein